MTATAVLRSADTWRRQKGEEEEKEEEEVRSSSAGPELRYAGRSTEASRLPSDMLYTAGGHS